MNQKYFCLFEGRSECGTNASVGYFFSWVWPRVQLFLSSLAPAILLLSLSSLVLANAIRLRVRHRRQMVCILMGPSPFAAPDTSFIGYHIDLRLEIRRQKQQQQQQLEAERLEEARREYLELVHLLPTAFVVALIRVLYLGLLLLYAHDPVVVALSGTVANSGSNSGTTVESSSPNLLHVRYFSLVLLVGHIAILSTHAAAFPLVALLCSPRSSSCVFYWLLKRFRRS